MSDGQAQQLAVALANLVGLIQPDFAELDLVLNLEIALGRARPDGASWGGQRLQETLEHLAVKDDRRHVGFAKARNLFEPLAETAAFLFDELEIQVRGGAGPKFVYLRGGPGWRAGLITNAPARFL
jgi:hypothetical protein